MKKIIPLLLLLLTVLPLKAQFVRNEGASIQINTGTYVRSGEWTNATATSTTALSGELLLTQDLVNNGTFAGANGSWLRFVGVALQNVEGTNQVALSNLQVNNGGNHLQLQNQVLINTQLDLTNGRLFSDLATIFFSPTALNPAETNANRIIGTAVMQARPIGVGAMPTFLNATLGAGADVGNVTLTRRTGAQGIINIAGNTSIASYWTFETTAGGTRDLTLSWLSDLDNGKDLTQLQRWRTASYNTIAAPWNQVAALSDLSVRTFTQSETDLQNSWTYSDAANPLGLIRCVDNQTANTVALACTYTHSDNTWNSTVSAIVTGLTYDLTGATTASGLTTLNGAVFNLGVTTVTATAVSPTLSQSCSFTVTVSDNVNPIITCPANITVNNESPICAGTRVCYPFPTATDNCQPYSAPITGYTYLGSIGSQSYYISNVAMDYPTGLASCRANGGYMAQIGDATEDAQLRTWVTAHFAGSPAPYFVGLTDLAIEGTFVWEDCSNTGYTNWAAGEPNNWAAGGEHATTVLGNGQWNDYPSYFSFSHILELNGAYITQTAGLLPNSVFPVGTTTNTFVATDAAGNTSTCSFDVIVNQYTYIDCPANISVNGDPLICGAIVTFPMPTACDAISVVQTAGLASGSVFPDGITTNTFVATDALGNTATCSFTVTVNVPPTVVCSADISVSSDPNVCGAVVNYPLPTACASFTITQTSGLPSGSLFPVGTTINRFVVTNAAGNSVDCSFTVTVADTNSPSIVCPANISANAAIGTCEATVTYPMPTSTDECSSYITQNSLSSIFLGGNGQNGNMFDITTSSSPIEINSFSQRFDNSGTTTMLVYYKVGTYVGSETNAAAWTLLGTATVTSPSIGAVVDVPIGGLQIPAGSVYGIYITTNGTNPIVSYTNGANTYSDANLTITTGVGKSYPFGSTFSPRTWNGTINYSVAVPNTVVVSQTAGLASGAIFPVGTTTNTFVVTDLAGNTATCSFDVTVTDNQNPTIACPANIS
ncbi:HYR domain-containing protein, partial [Hugenholtzia roseola]|uniref:HYR domain-containing protein n=1 Tax=Hugenholtzia roseola TaxID=1002 RepID=UPI00054D95A8